MLYLLWFDCGDVVMEIGQGEGRLHFKHTPPDQSFQFRETVLLKLQYRISLVALWKFKIIRRDFFALLS